MRPLHANERPIVEALFLMAGFPVPEAAMAVESASDDGMGSLAFAPSGRRLGGTVAECQFSDADGVLVMAALNLDEDGRPLELDLWEVNFAPLLRWPWREDLARLFTERPSH